MSIRITRRSLARTLVAIAIGVGGVIVWRGSLASETVRTPRSSSAATDAGDATPSAAELAAAPSNRREPEPPGPTVIGDAPPAEREGVLVTGTVRFDDGRPAPSRCSFLLCPRDEGGSASVEAIDGRFEARVTGLGRFYATAITVDDVDGVGQLVADDAVGGMPLELVLAAPKSLTLRVVDPTTREPIAGVRAYPAAGELFERDWLRSAASLPADPVIGGSDGLVRLPPAAGTQEWCLIAHGRAWTWTKVTFDAGTALTVEMAPGGSVAVSVPNWSRVPGARLSWVVSEPEATQRLPVPDAQGYVRVDGLIAGVGSIVLTNRAGPSGEVVYGSASAEILAGHVTDVRLEATAVETAPTPAVEAPRVVVRGTIEVGEGWQLPPLLSLDRREGRFLRVLQTSVWHRETDPPGRYRFNSFPAPPGEYVLSIACADRAAAHRATCVCVRPLTVGAEALSLDVRVPAPTEARVRVVDARTGEAIVRASVLWHPLAATELGFPFLDARRDDAAVLHRFLTVPGRAAVLAMADGYVRAAEEFDVEAGGATERTIRLHRAATVVVHLQIDGKPAPIDRVSISCEVGGASVTEESSRGEAAFAGLEPGATTVEVDDFPGFVKPPPVTVDVKAGETKDVVVELKRAD